MQGGASLPLQQCTAAPQCLPLGLRFVRRGRAAVTGAFQRGDEGFEPVLDVAGSQLRHHRFPAQPPLRRGHRERHADGAGHAVDVMRVDDQRGRKLVRGASEF